MPTLGGFLKKKRARSGAASATTTTNTTTASAPTSPVAGIFLPEAPLNTSWSRPPSAAAHQSASSPRLGNCTSSSTAVPATGANGEEDHSGEAAATAATVETPEKLQPRQHQEQQHQMSGNNNGAPPLYASAPPPPPPPPPSTIIQPGTANSSLLKRVAEAQSIPSICNLISPHQPPHDHHHHQHPPQQAYSPSQYHQHHRLQPPANGGLGLQGGPVLMQQPLQPAQYPPASYAQPPTQLLGQTPQPVHHQPMQQPMQPPDLASQLQTQLQTQLQPQPPFPNQRLPLQGQLPPQASAVPTLLSPAASQPPARQAAAGLPRVTKGKYSLADFELLRTLGTGSFGRVHLVQSKHNGRFYAVKVLKKAQVVKMKQVEHTNDERRMLGEVKNPFLITLWGTFQDPKNLYMVMDFVEGGELFSLLRKSGRFPNPVAKFYAAEVTLALEYLHSKHIIYRDLKPENLLLDRHGHLKITDFGFAKRVPDKTWTLCGTPDYLAPEVVNNKGYNKSVDWWSLGILIYEMLCGYTPFWDAGSPMKIYENILRERVKYPPYLHPDAQNLLERLITHDLSKRLGNLYGGAQDVKDHQWFAEVTWDRLARKDIDAPYTPPVKAGAGDTSQFDRYPEETERYGQPGNDEFGHLFGDF